MSILVVLEQRGELRNCALEAASAAGQLAKKAGKDLYAVLIGDSVESQIGKLAGLGVKKVYLYESPSLKHYSSQGYVPIVQGLATEMGAEIIIGSASAQGKEFCAALAAKLDVELAQDCIGLDWNDSVVVKKPMYAGKVVAGLRLTDSIQFASLRPNMFKVDKQGDDKPEVEKKDAPEASIKTPIASIPKFITPVSMNALSSAPLVSSPLHSSSSS